MIVGFKKTSIRNKRRFTSRRIKKRSKWKKRFWYFILGVGALLTIASIVGILWFLSYIGYINSRLPDPGKFVSVPPELATKIYDRDGGLLYTVYENEYREFVSLDEVPDHLKWAILSAEDIDFYSHKGVDWEAITKSLLRRVLKVNYRITGASTVTQQLVRNVILAKVWGDEAFARSITRKVVEIIVSTQLEKKLSKDEILELYINEVPLGGVNYGVKAAAKAYFNKDPKDLTLAESAFIAGLIHRPSYYIFKVKDGDVTEALQRRNHVLDLMYKYRHLTKVTKEEIEQAKKEPLVLKQGTIDIKAPHFVFYVMDVLEDMYGAEVLRTGGLHVKTTLDPKVYEISESVIKEKMPKYCDWYGACNAAVVIINPKNGEILTMIGSVDYNKTDDPRIDGNVNVAVSPRQMGSTAKPYAYLAAFERGYFPGTVAPDVPMKFGDYRPLDWDKGYKGIMVMAEALNASRNIPAVYTLELAGGASSYVNLAKRLGLKSLGDPDRYGLSIAIGSAEMKLLEHTTGYATIASGGIYHEPTAILEIKDRDDKVIYKYDVTKNQKRVVDSKTVYMLNWILCRIGGNHMGLSNWAFYLPGQKLCGKTGTTNGPKDLAAMLYYPRLTIGVWAGNNNGDKTYGTRGQGWGASVPLPIANDIMKQLVPRFGYEFYKAPIGIRSVSVCRDSGYLAKGEDNPCPKKTVVASSSSKIPVDNTHIKLPICKPTGKIATNADEARQYGLIEDKWFFKFELPIKYHTSSYLAYLRDKLGYNLWRNRPEEAVCSLDSLPQIIINNPVAGTEVPMDSDLFISGHVSSSSQVEKIVIRFNDTVINTLENVTDFSVVYHLGQTVLPGKHYIKVEAFTADDLSNANSVEITVVNPLPTVTPTPTPTPTVSVTPTVIPTPISTPTPTP